MREAELGVSISFLRALSSEGLLGASVGAGEDVQRWKVVWGSKDEVRVVEQCAERPLWIMVARRK